MAKNQKNSQPGKIGSNPTRAAASFASNRSSLDSAIDSGDLRFESLDARRRRPQLDEFVADRLGFARDPVAHRHANAIGPLTKRLRAATGEKLFDLERCRSRDVVSRQPFAGPVRGECARVAFENDDFPLEPEIRRLRHFVDAAGEIGGVLHGRGRRFAPGPKLLERVTQA